MGEGPNILFITVDDMNYNSVGRYLTPSVTPNIDSLTGEGLYFENAHVNVSVCQPSRQCMMTGRYPHNNGSYGFSPISHGTPTLPGILSEAGYWNGIISKVGHLAPIHKYCWDYIREYESPRYLWGRNPELYYAHVAEFLQSAGERPFFLMVNSNDPHRPFAGSEQELQKFGRSTEAPIRYRPEDVEVPGFLPDIPGVRREVAQYYSSVHRCDRTVGLVLKALKESGRERDTLVVFLSDNGMAFPFAKTNCYLNSTKTPLILRWPGKIEAGRVDEENFVSAVDFMPTILDLLGLPRDEGSFDGRSFRSLLEGGAVAGAEDGGGKRDRVFTLFNANFRRDAYEMRCVQTRKFGYIYNDWSDGETRFFNESMSGLSFKAMEEAGRNNPEIAERVEFFLRRVPEEFYDFERDPEGLDNLIGDPGYREQIAAHRRLLEQEMARSGDPRLGSYTAHLKKAPL